MKDGLRVKLTGEELENAEEEFKGTVEKQTETLDALRTLRASIMDLKEKIKETDDRKLYHEIKDKLEAEQAKYKSLRYQDSREYSPNVLVWKNAFLDYLKSLGQKNPNRIVRMAVDVILPFESENESLRYVDLLNCKLIRDLISRYRSESGTTNTTKLKYIRTFQQLLTFVVSDVSSPERKENQSNEEIISSGLKLGDVTREINNQCTILSKLRGSDIIVTKQKAKAKLLTSDELATLTSQTHDQLCSTLEDFKSKKHFGYSKKEIAHVRNSLITIGALRLGKNILINVLTLIFYSY